MIRRRRYSLASFFQTFLWLRYSAIIHVHHVLSLSTVKVTAVDPLYNANINANAHTASMDHPRGTGPSSSAPSPTTTATKASLVSIEVYAGPSLSDETKCPDSERVSPTHYVTLHYNATIDASSRTGQRGLLVDTTHNNYVEHPDPVMLHMGDEDPLLGWSRGLLGLCTGDFVLLKVPPELAYGDAGDGGHIPGGATLKLDIEIVTAHPNPEIHYRRNLNAEKMFREMDSNADGKVTLEEMEIFLDVPENYTNRESFIRQHFQLSDYNKDGTVSLDEFKTILENFQGIENEL